MTSKMWSYWKKNFTVLHVAWSGTQWRHGRKVLIEWSTHSVKYSFGKVLNQRSTHSVKYSFSLALDCVSWKKIEQIYLDCSGFAMVFLRPKYRAAYLDDLKRFKRVFNTDTYWNYAKFCMILEFLWALLNVARTVWGKLE